MFVNEKKIFRNVCYTYMYMYSILVYVKHKITCVTATWIGRDIKAKRL